MKVRFMFDTSRLEEGLRRLEPSALQNLLKRFAGDIDRLPFDIVIGQFAPTIVARSADEVVVGLGLALRDEQNAAA